jgi:hypothetical protein
MTQRGGCQTIADALRRFCIAGGQHADKRLGPASKNQIAATQLTGGKFCQLGQLGRLQRLVNLWSRLQDDHGPSGVGA